MRLHTKLILILAVILFTVINLGQYIQYRSTEATLHSLCDSSLELLRNREKTNANTIHKAIVQAVADSLEQGEMDKFEKLLSDQKSVPGVLEFSLYNKDGVVTYSAQPEFLNKKLPMDISSQISSGSKTLEMVNAETLDYYSPQIVTQDCLECHAEWKVGEVGGVICHRFSAKALTEAETTFNGTLNTIHQTSFLQSITIVIVVMLIIVFTMFVVVRRMISFPLARGLAMMKEMTLGHLGMRLNMNSSDEVGQLADAMDEFAEELQTKVVHVLQMISNGDLSQAVAAKDDQDEIGPAMQQMIQTLQNLVKETASLAEAATHGDLSQRGNLDLFKGSYHEIIQGVNHTLDAVIGPLNVAADYVDRISKGTIPAKITDSYNGDFNAIKNNLNTCIDAVNALVADASMLSMAAIEGRLATRADASNHQGDYRKIVQGVNDTLDAVIGPLNVAADYVDRISKGNIPAKITDSYNGDFNAIKNNLNTCIEAVNALVADAATLSKAAVEGHLATRADASRHQGDYRKIVQGVNDTLDAVIGPLNVAADYVDRISKGTIPAKISDSYNGDFNAIKNNLNTCIDAVNALVADAAMLSDAAVQGRLATRADATRHRGDYRKIVQGVNDTLDAVIGPLNVAADYVDRISNGNIPAKITDSYNGDFNTIKNNLNTCIEAVNALVADAAMLSKAAVEGRLATRADASRHHGDYRKIVQGVNDTLDAVIGPLNVAANYVDRISNGDIPPRITDSYNGDFNAIKNNLNRCIEALRGLIEEDGGQALQAAASRDMTRRVNRQYSGAYDNMKENINKVLQSLDEALVQVASSVEQVNAASNQISEGSQTLAEGANEQASSLEEVSASLQEIASTTRQNAANANHAKSLSNESRRSAEKGNGAMTRMEEAINKIKASSDETAKIVKTIDEIAFQTNLLALNAAVEAARAGDAGKGFAVVAEEVRNLAQRSATAAKNTADLIEESVRNSKGGVDISHEVAVILREIVDGSKKVSDVISEIAAASDEQSRGIEQVNTAVAQMNTVTQQNAANSEESAAAAQELRSQAEELASMCATFKLSENGSSASTLSHVNRAAELDGAVDG